jgi:hypothetical protein
MRETYHVSAYSSMFPLSESLIVEDAGFYC